MTSNDNDNPADKAETVEFQAVDKKWNEPISFDLVKHHAKVAEKLAFRLVWVFLAVLVLHYTVFLFLVLKEKPDAIPQLSDYLHIWFPALTALVSAATAYYFAKEK